MQAREHLRRSACLWLTLLCAAPSLAQEEKPIFLVTDIVVDEGVAIDKDAARDVLAKRFGRIKDKLEVRSLSEVKSTLDRAAMAQMLGSSSSDAELQKIGEYVATDRLVFGRIANVAGVTDVQVKIFNAKEGVTEIALSRRLKAGAPPQLVLTLLDTLADGLAAFAIDTYTDGAPSAAFMELKNKKIVRAPVEEAQEPASPWSMLGVVGGVVAGAGIGAGALGGYALGSGQGDQQTGIILLGAGAGALLVGTGLVVVDGL
jgi:hypothetical protein